MSDEMQSESTYVAPEAGEALWFFGMLVLVKASGAQTGGRFCLTEQVGRRGVATPLHRQLTDEETFFVLDGEVRFFLDGREPVSAMAGATAYIPAGTVHAFAVVSETARWLNLTTPNHEAFFRAAGQGFMGLHHQAIQLRHVHHRLARHIQPAGAGDGLRLVGNLHEA